MSDALSFLQLASIVVTAEMIGSESDSCSSGVAVSMASSSSSISSKNASVPISSSSDVIPLLSWLG